MYKANSSTINLRKQQAYAANPDIALIRGKAYYKNNSYSIRNKTLKAYYRNHQLNKEHRRQGYIKSVHKVLDKRRIARLVVGSICKKYNKIRATLPSFTTRCISLVVKKMSSKTLAGKHLSAEHLVKTSLYYRETYQREFVKAFQHLRSSVYWHHYLRLRNLQLVILARYKAFYVGKACIQVIQNYFFQKCVIMIMLLMGKKSHVS